ncbi:MAG TPA: pyridoxal-phosphate dependent enzyme [Chitinophagaceae bacterium]|nr:pyridoxal-phosphate dependent enzyme [Chitinophagaceae bacterium]
MQPLLFEAISVDEVDLPLLKEKNVRLSVLRLDKIHPIISGNKWFKLKYHLIKARDEKKENIITFGGAYSNHIIATAAAGKLSGFKTTGIIRGERPKTLSHTLLQAMEFGMELIFVGREDYRKKKIPAAIIGDHHSFYFINEGGYGPEGARGATEILEYCEKENYSHIACALGTSTMMAGLVKASLPYQEVIGISVIKSKITPGNDLHDLLSAQEQLKKYRINETYFFEGYARYTPDLMNFMNGFYRDTSIPTDFVYTGKLFFAITDMIKNNEFPSESHVLGIHSGGLQGNLSLPPGTLIF